MNGRARIGLRRRRSSCAYRPVADDEGVVRESPSGDLHGHTSHLTDAQIADLVTTQVGTRYAAVVPVSFDDAAWPVLYVQLKDAMTEDEFVWYLDQYTRAIARGPVVIVHDARASALAPLEQQRRQAAWMNQNRKLIGEKCLGVGFVFESVAMNFMLSAILLIARMGCPYTIVDTVEASRAWCERQLQKGGLR